ncbi:MAG TPA: hypothetical protein DEG17_17420 [Cyanobacteria bacterium UBA11149]|nr:hypothetical protein [Cyanobacteria bacterium UBA11367]HBE59481.1 hypothetical protein [Cyanobacteria bacterium UBA11366]HBK65563.1 hypothetical protein [Cyanobacteria bacterium UBA11166]HBR75168.1 hypothetical protein [Cyanobacteria bacterium UBA11159]HBS68742.1 hypothetical protein [Cyanobacteria bacterium UBA11153]HBW90602.1 hypothetical protein [Cyanobacteria bacterium UBA11149]HCA95827.1 hypothetical protein [Cyanobacteria bacterium UBA9226]
MKSEQEQQWLEDFVDQSKDNLYRIEQGLLHLQGVKNLDLLYQILRDVHSVKEGAAILGLKSIERIAHDLQHSLEIMRDSSIAVDRKLESLLLQVFDALCLLFNKIEEPFGLRKDIENKIIVDTEPIVEELKLYLNSLSDTLVPFAEIEQIFPLKSAVQKAASDYGKQVEVIVEGKEILISTSLLKNLPRLLAHLINNAISHGIEMPEVRQKAGKSPVGEILIRAFKQGNKTVISFADDGAGIDVERVKMKAISKGLITMFQSQSFAHEDFYELLYHPDFSTRDERDLRAGTGFGLDIVRTELNKIGGVINTSSIPGKGTNFTIVYP